MKNIKALADHIKLTVGKVDDTESGGPRLESRSRHNQMCLCLRKAFYLMVVLNNYHLLYVDYENGMLRCDCRLRVEIHNIHGIKAYNSIKLQTVTLSKLNTLDTKKN